MEATSTWVDAAKEGALTDLRQALQESAEVQARIAWLRTMLDALAAVGEGSADPQEHAAGDGTGTRQQHPGGGLRALPGPGKTKGARAGRVRTLLDSTPGKDWKATDIALALGVRNVHSLRGLLQTMVAREEIDRDSKACYRSKLPAGTALVPRAASPSPGPGEDGDREAVITVMLGRPLRWWRADEVCSKLGRTDTRVVRKILEKLAGDGVLQRNGSRRFQLVETAAPAGAPL